MTIIPFMLVDQIAREPLPHLQQNQSKTFFMFPIDYQQGLIE